jgi:acyl-coenzyme A synthetase/AMP-(fatty) acid ligase
MDSDDRDKQDRPPEPVEPTTDDPPPAPADSVPAAETPESPSPDDEPGAPIVNVSVYLSENARRMPYLRAVVDPVGRDDKGRVAYSHLTYRQLDRESDTLARGLADIGIIRGRRTIVMVPPSPAFFSLIFALFKVGAVPVIVDPGMGIQGMIRCLQKSRPLGFIGIPRAHLLRKRYPKYFKSVRVWVTVGRKWFWGGFRLDDLRNRPWKPYPVARTQADETAAVLFTTGSTGPAKGAVYTHGMFDAQVRLIRNSFDIQAGEIDLPTFPLFALFGPALGMTSVIPDMDPTLPAEADPHRLIEAIDDQGVTNMFASPALLDRLGRFGSEHGITLPSLRRVISAGAPVSPRIIEVFSRMLPPEAKIHTPYGATEAMPVTSISGEEILSETKKYSEQGFGNCIGRPLEETDVRVVSITDTPLSFWNDQHLLPVGDIGEIVVGGPQVSQGYFEHKDADVLSKIREGNHYLHRMGDLGWVDNKGRLWYCGRKSHRVITDAGTLFTIPCESIFNNHPSVNRSALVGVGQPPRQTPLIFIEPTDEAEKEDKENLRRVLLALAKENVQTKSIEDIRFHKPFPVDVRHNAKIYREELAKLAAEKKEP